MQMVIHNSLGIKREIQLIEGVFRSMNVLKTFETGVLVLPQPTGDEFGTIFLILEQKKCLKSLLC